MKLGILAKGDRNWMGGVQYTLNLIRALHQLPEHERPETVLLMPHHADRDLFAPAAELVTVQTLPNKPAHANAAHQPLIDCLHNERIDVLFPCMRSMGADFPIPWLPWIPDLQHHHLPHLFDPDEFAHRDARHAAIARDANAIVFSSRSAAADFQRAHPNCHAQMHTLPFATVPDPAWFDGDPIAVAAKHRLPPRFLLIPNQFWTHKNHAIAFDAIRLLITQQRDVHLVCTGRMDDPRRPDHMPNLLRKIERDGTTNHIHLLGLLSRTDQVQLMRAACAVVQPSLFEGWSTVVEDARLLGKPIFLSDISVHREQNPPRAFFFDPNDANALAQCIQTRWPSLKPGPIPDAEAAALHDQQARTTAFARHLVHIAQQAVNATILL